MNAANVLAAHADVACRLSTEQECGTEAAPCQAEVSSMRMWLGLVAALCATACGGGNTGPQSGQQAAPGSETSARTAALESAANAVQSKGPVSKISYYLDGFHPAKADPEMQMEAHHYCNQVNQDFAQCVLYDGNTADARLMGVEYIVSAKVYETLPEGEKAFWHPHNYEILSGQLRMPGVPEAAEKAALKDKINSYGKTWHTWMTGVHGGGGDQLPLGPAQLQWSFNHDGEALPGLVEDRDKRIGLDTAQARADRADLAPLATPQGGVEALAGLFPDAKAPIPGVRDNGDQATKAVPTFGMKGAEPRPTGR
jgi:hypothetical protein